MNVLSSFLRIFWYLNKLLDFLEYFVGKFMLKLWKDVQEQQEIILNDPPRATNLSVEDLREI